MPYTDDEISASVQKVALTNVRRNTGSLGEKQIAQTFTDVQEAALSVFLLYQTSPFYVIFLGTSRLLETVASQVANLMKFEQALLDSGRRVLPVDNVTPLTNATAALFELQSAVTARASAFASIEKTPAFQRFSANVDTFLSQNGPAVKSNGNVTQTPQEAKATLKQLLPDILATQVTLQENAKFLQDALNNYSALNLPSVAAQGVVGRASQAVAQLAATLNPLTPTGRLEHLRLGILDLLTSRSVLRGVGAFTVPAPIFSTTGAATAFADETHPCTPASVQATIRSPYGIDGSPLLSIALDGNAPVTTPLTPSLYAQLTGSNIEPFTFTNLAGAAIVGTVAETFNISLGVNDLLVIYVFDVVVQVSTQVFCVLTAGGARTAAQVSADINAALAGVALDAQYEAVAGGPSNQRVVLRSKTGTEGSLVRITVGQGTAGTTLGLLPGVSASGTDSNRHFIVAPNGVPFPMDFTAGSTSAASVASQINASLGPNIEALAEGSTGFQYVTVRYVGASPFAATLELPSSNNAAADVLGLVKGAKAYAQATTARDLVLRLKQTTPAVDASSVVIPLANGENVLMRSEVTDPSMVVIYKARGAGTTTPGIGNTLTMVDSSGDFLAKGVQLGDILVFRDGVNLNTLWVVTAVTSTSVDASGSAPAVAGATEYEIGPNLPVVVGDVVEVLSGMQNGTYAVVDVGPTSLNVPFELELRTTIPGFQTAAFGPRFFRGTVGEERLRLASRSTGADSAITVSGPAAALFFTSPPASAVGTTPWVRLPSAVPSLSAGDSLEDYQSTYNVPTDVFPLQSVTDDVVGIQPATVSLGRSFDLTPDTTVPYAVLRSSAFTKYQTMSQRLGLWLELSVNQDPFMKELQRRVNIILYEPAPAPDQVNAAFTYANNLLESLLNTASPAGTLTLALEEYVVSPVDQVDALIRTFLEKGAQRAIDILLQGRFSDFFGLDVDGVSYSGAMQSKMREVARNDLVVRKIDRKMSSTSPVQSSSESPDYEYDVSSIEQVTPKNVPNEFDRVPSTRGDPTANS